MAATSGARDIIARMRHDGCDGKAGKVKLLTDIEGASVGRCGRSSCSGAEVPHEARLDQFFLFHFTQDVDQHIHSRICETWRCATERSSLTRRILCSSKSYRHVHHRRLVSQHRMLRYAYRLTT